VWQPELRSPALANGARTSACCRISDAEGEDVGFGLGDGIVGEVGLGAGGRGRRGVGG
jgi:hypothetical protein